MAWFVSVLVPGRTERMRRGGEWVMCGEDAGLEERRKRDWVDGDGVAWFVGRGWGFGVGGVRDR